MQVFIVYVETAASAGPELDSVYQTRADAENRARLIAYVEAEEVM